MTETEQHEGGLVLGAWRPEVHQALLDVINKYGINSEGYDPARPPLVALDCDETLIHNDLGEAMMRFMITRRRLKTDRGFWYLIPDNLGRDAIQAAYKAVAGRADSEVRDTAAFRRYRAGMLNAYEWVRENEGLEAAYLFAARMLRGLHERTVADLVVEVLDYELGRPLGQEEVPPGPPFAGMVVPTGVRVYREMLNLIQMLKTYGFDTWIVTSSNAQIVRGLSKWLRLTEEGEPLIAEDHVLGIELTTQSGCYTDKPNEPIPAGEGKLEVFLDSAGRSPVLAIGDSMNDFEMLENCEGLAIVIDRGDEDLADKADDMEWMLQPPLSV